MTGVSPDLPSNIQLAKSTLFALALAGVVLITIVLPAEYGIDPLGTGDLLDLSSLSEPANETTEFIPNVERVDPVSALPVTVHQMELKTETKIVALEAFEGLEMKVSMSKGDHFVFSWNSTERPVFTDMHGEKFASEDEFSTYWKEKQQTNGKGSFTAPFDGTHGWYWQNMGEETITIKLQVSGFFDSIGIK